MKLFNFVAQNRKELEKSNYVRKATPKTNYWFSIYRSKLSEFQNKFGDDFNIVFFGDESVEGDFFTIPFQDVKHIFQDDFLSNDQQSSARWVGNIKHFRLIVSHCPISLDLSSYYGDETLLEIKNLKIIRDGRDKYVYKSDESVEDNDKRKNDFAIENRKIEIEARQKQSRFRKDVLKNFQGRCCISDITEENLLVASHIIPWAKRIDTRLDPSNGLCLSILYDKLFDKGYISFDENFEVIIINSIDNLSEDLQKILNGIAGTRMRQPIKYRIKQEYLEFHRDEVFGKNL